MRILMSVNNGGDVQKNNGNAIRDNVLTSNGSWMGNGIVQMHRMKLNQIIDLIHLEIFEYFH